MLFTSASTSRQLESAGRCIGKGSVVRVAVTVVCEAAVIATERALGLGFGKGVFWG